MDIYDTEAVQRVWQRVGITPAQAPETQTLPALIRQEQTLCRSYRALTGREPVFTCLAGQAAEHVRQLQAVYYVQTGQRTDRSCPERQRLCLTPELLRQLLGQCQALANAYQQENWGYPELFDRLAGEQERHGRILLQLLAKRM